MLRLLMLCSLLWCLSLLAVDAQTTHPCSENSVDYSSPPPSIEQKIKLAKLTRIEKPPARCEKEPFSAADEMVC